jgi:hypothetical protein
MGRLCADNVAHGNRPNSYAQAIGVVNDLCDPRDRVVTAAGGLPAEVTANWRTLDIGTVDVEFGFSCMGYEIAGGWGARIAQSEREPDKRHHRLRRRRLLPADELRHLLLCSDAKKLIILVLDNGGFAVINKLQNNTGNESFNNLIADCPTVPNPSQWISRRMRAIHGGRCRHGGQPGGTGRGVQARQGVRQDQRHRHAGRPLRGLDHGRPHLVGSRHAAGLGQSQRPRKACRDGKPNAPSSGRGSEMDLLGQPVSSSSAVRGWISTPTRRAPRPEHATQLSSPAWAGPRPISGWRSASSAAKADLVTCVSHDAIGRALPEPARPLRRRDGSPCAIGRGEARNSLAVVETTIEDHQSVIYRNGAADFEMTRRRGGAVDYAAYSGADHHRHGLCRRALAQRGVPRV